jgi:CRP-like cAMP-binding protein
MRCEGVFVVPGGALKMRAAVLRGAAANDSVLSTAVTRSVQMLLASATQRAVCHAFHPVEQRFMGWLLTVSDLVDDGHVPMTHDLMATMLGVHRPTITVAVRALHKEGIIEEQRGLIAIRDRRRLEKACCECYRVLRGERKRLLGY